MCESKGDYRLVHLRICLNKGNLLRSSATFTQRKESVQSGGVHELKQLQLAAGDPVRGARSN